MALNDLNNQLYDPNSNVERRGHEDNQYDPRFAADNLSTQQSSDWSGIERDALDIKKKRKINWKKIGIISSIVFGCLLVLGLGYLVMNRVRQSLFSEDLLIFKIDGPSQIESNYPATFKIKYKNDNKTDINNAEVLLNYSSNFEIEKTGNMREDGGSSVKINIGTVEANSEGEVSVSGRFYAPQDFMVYLQSTLNYSPQGFSSTFQKKDRIGVNVESSPLVIDIVAPNEVANESLVTYEIKYKNSGSKVFNGLKLKVEYPAGYEFSKADPAPTDSGNSWYLGSLNPGEEGKISIQGTMRGERNENKQIKVSLGVIGEGGDFVAYSNGNENTKIVKSPLVINQTVNNSAGLSVFPGQILNYYVNFRNDGDSGLKDVIIELQVRSNVVDFSRIQLERGTFDAKNNIVTWKAADVPSLANIDPGAQGRVGFSVPVMDAEAIALKNRNGSKFLVESMARIDAANLPVIAGKEKIVSSNVVEVKIGSPITLGVLGFYNDANLKNSGPIPPEAGKETTYTVHWSITNPFNDISETKVVSSLPSGAKWMGRTFPGLENIKFNERTNEVVWEPGEVKAGSGVFSPSKEVSFQIALTPNPGQVGDNAIIINASKLTAKDMFTGLEVQADGKAKETYLPEDSSIPDTGYRVR